MAEKTMPCPVDEARPFTPDALERALLDAYQDGFPLTERPYQAIADRCGVTEDAVIAAVERMQAAKAISRVGAVVRPNTAGASTLAAMAVPPERLDAVAAQVNGYAQVTHNYERQHRLNLWFVVTATDRETVETVLQDIERATGIAVLDLTLVEDYHIDLGFPLQWT
jgi:DNA-binding Lrp family transcriptional regulator